jgi:hypothetical protein
MESSLGHFTEDGPSFWGPFFQRIVEHPAFGDNFPIETSALSHLCWFTFFGCPTKWEVAETSSNPWHVSYGRRLGPAINA